MEDKNKDQLTDKEKDNSQNKTEAAAEGAKAQDVNQDDAEPKIQEEIQRKTTLKYKIDAPIPYAPEVEGVADAQTVKDIRHSLNSYNLQKIQEAQKQIEDMDLLKKEQEATDVEVKREIGMLRHRLEYSVAKALYHLGDF